VTETLTDTQRERRRQQAHTSITNALAASWTEWRRTGRKPDFTKAADYAMDGLGDLAAEILADGTMMRALTVQDGVATLELEPATDILKIFVASMRGVLDGYGAENYLETEMQAPSVSMDLRDGNNPMDSYTVTIQRRTCPTPHEFRQKAEARVAELEQAMTEIRHLHKDSPMGPCPVCIDSDAMALGDDGTVPYPCPTARLAGAKDCDPPAFREDQRG
jgi:hypothetical protein